MDEDTIDRTIDNMRIYGGSFVKELAVLFRLADGNNRQKLLTTFSNYFEQYHPRNWDRKE